MTRAQFIAALAALREHCCWDLSPEGMIRGMHGTALGYWPACPLTALYGVQFGRWVDPTMFWDRAAEALGLPLHEASDIVSAADNDGEHDSALRQALLAALGLHEEAIHGTT